MHVVCVTIVIPRQFYFVQAFSTDVTSHPQDHDYYKMMTVISFERDIAALYIYICQSQNLLCLSIADNQKYCQC